jgi:Uma2 family endonuclease
MTVRIGQFTAYEPDALVHCGAELAPSALEVPDPIVVEVLSPGTRHIDLSKKPAGYFRVPSIAHYLLVDPLKPSIIHHARAAGETILTRIVTAGVFALDPPGLALAVGDLYGAEQSPSAP